MHLFYYLVCAVVVLFASNARADCVNPAGEEAVFVYNTNYKTMQFCNGTHWIGMAGGVMPTLPGATMFDGWPDAIVCDVSNPAWGPVTLFPHHMPLTSSGKYIYRTNQEYRSALNKSDGLVFNADRTFASLDGNGDWVTTSCNGKSIAELYAAGKAFNFTGGGGGGGGAAATNATIIEDWPDALLCTDNGGTPAPTGRQSLFVLNAKEPSGIVGYAWMGSGPNFWGYEFNADGSYKSTYSNPSVADTTDCANKSITQLYAGGQAIDLSGAGPVSDILGSLACATGEIAKWNGAAWTCAADGGGGGSSVWLPGANTADIHYNGGNVGVWSDAPSPASPTLDKTFDVRGEGVFRGRVSLTQYDKDPTAGNATWHIDNDADKFRIFRQPDISTAGFAALTILQNGNVGIGTSAPVNLVHIKGIEAGIFLEETAGGANNEAYLVHFQNRFQIQNRTSTSGSAVVPYNFDIRAPANTIFTTSAGNVGIGATNPTRKLLVDTASDYAQITRTAGATGPVLQIGNDGCLSDIGQGDGFGVTLCTDANSFGSVKANIINPSSREYKKAITPVTDDRREEFLGILENLDIKTYRYKKEGDDTEPHLGVIAEESPALIIDRDDPKGLSNYDYTSLAVLGAQEALRLVREIKAENDALRAEFQAYKDAHP